MQDLSYADAVLYASILYLFTYVYYVCKRSHFSVRLRLRLLLVVGYTNRSPCTAAAMLPACWEKELKGAINNTRHVLQISIAFVISAIGEFAFGVIMP